MRGRQTARQLADRLGVDKRSVNASLYGSLSGQVSQDRNYGWSLSGTEVSTPDLAGPGASDTPLERLCQYYLACIGQDDAGVSVFAQSKFGQPDYAELPVFPGSDSELWAQPPAQAMLGKVRRDRSRLNILLGYPTALTLLKSRRSSWQGYMVQPVFLFPLTMDDAGHPRLNIGYPLVNQKALGRLTNATGADVLQELVQLETELGLADGEEPPEVDDLVQRLATIRPEWPWKQAPDLAQLSLEQPLAEVHEEGIFNRVVLVVTERPPFTVGLETELAQLARSGPDDLRGTALGDWLSRSIGEAASESRPPLEVLPMNLEQRQAVQSALSNPLTVITGPPGTGKSQVVTNLLVNAAWHGQKVLFASKNNKAVDVVEARVNNLGTRPMLMRVGANQYQGRLAEYLLALLSASASEHDRDSYGESLELHNGLTEKLTALDAEAAGLVEARNHVDALEQRVEDVRQRLGAQLFSSLRYVDTETLGRSAIILLNVLRRARRDTQPWLVRLLWTFLRRPRYTTLAREASVASPLFESAGLQEPRRHPDELGMSEWLRFGDELAQRVSDAQSVTEYFEALEALQAARSLESISAEQAEVLELMESNAANLWKSWLRLQPDRFSSSDRALLSRYVSLLKMVIDSADQQLPKEVAKQYRALFAQVSHMLPCWAVTSLSARGRIPFKPGYFDLVVFDEASQCDIASALPLLYRAKRTVVIGDTKQLSHISGMVRGQDQQLLDKYRLAGEFPHWAYSYNSLFDLAAGHASSEAIVSLRDHHRSHQDIISFSNKTFYEGQLRVATRYDSLRRPHPDAPGVRWVNVDGACKRPATGGALNEVEGAAVVHVLRELVIDRGYRGTVGVVSPFRAQTNHIRRIVEDDLELSERLVGQDFLAETVHRFQGDERDVMLFSPVVASNAPSGAISFLRHNGNLFNVAITRARAQLVVVGDLNACAHCDVSYLAEFAHYAMALEGEDEEERHAGYGRVGPEYPEVANPEQVSDWERILYRALYASGIRALPQYAVEKYRLDFAVFDGDRGLDIEVDGERYHRNWSGELCRRDQLRNQRLFELGWDVMRFWVYEIRDDLDACVTRVAKWRTHGDQGTSSGSTATVEGVSPVTGS